MESFNTSYENRNEELYDTFYKVVMSNLCKLEDNDRYFNWYHGYTQIKLPEYMGNYFVDTAASSGTIATEHFGEEFDADKVERHLHYKVSVYPPYSVKSNPNITLHFDIEKISMRDISHGHYDAYGGLAYTSQDNARKISLNFTQPNSHFYKIDLERKVSLDDVMSQRLDQMPGFRFSWYYSGMEGKVKPEAKKYKNKEETRAFVRYKYKAYIVCIQKHI